MDIQTKKELEALADKIDYRTNKMKRIFTYGFLSKPAWVRAGFWFVLGNLTLAIIQSY